MNEKIAIPLSGTPSIVLLDNGDRMTRAKALKAGYRIADAASLVAANAEPGKGNALSAWRSQVSGLPEAQGRPSAAAQLIEEQPLMSIDRVRTFLRGLPVETEQTNTTEETMTTNNDPRAARLAEISDGMRAFNKDRGFAVKPKAAPSIASIEPAKLRRLAEIRLAALNAKGTNSAERTNLAYALQVHEQTGSPLTTVFGQLGIDTSKLVPNNI